MFNFNGISAKNIPWLRVKDIQGSVLPPLRRRYVTVPGKEGAYHAGRDVGIRREVITVKVNGDSLEGLMEKRRFLADWLDTEETAPFFYDHEPTKVYRAVLSEETNLDQVIYYGEVDLIFEMPDPYAESIEKKTARLQGATVHYLFTDFSEEGTLIDLVADENGMRLAKEGQDFIVRTDANWEEGTHNNTVEVGNEYLQLEKKGPDIERIYPDQIDWDDPENTRDGMGNSANYLGLVDLPKWNFVDYMWDYEENWRIQSPAAGGEVIQEEDYVTIRGSAMGANYGIDTQENTSPDVTVSFPCTVYILYRGRNSDGARFIIEDGSNYAFTIRFQGDDDNTWNHYWIRCTTTEAYVYKNGVLVNTVPVRTGGGAANQMQFDIQNGTSADYDIGAIYADWDFDKGPPPTDGWFSGTWETPYIDLSPVSLVQSASIGWAFWYSSYNWEWEEDVTSFADVRIEYQLRKDGVEQGWKTIFDNPFDEGVNDFFIPDILPGTDLSGTEIKIRVSFKTRDPEGRPLLEFLELRFTSPYLAGGHWDSPVLTDIQQVGKAARSEVTWAVDSLPAGTSIKVYVRHRLNNADPWGDWVEVVNSGDPFPGIDPTTDLSTAEIQYRVELNTTDVSVTPSVDWLQLTFYTGYKPAGQWLSPPISLEDANIVGDSTIFFTWNGIQDVQLEARVNGGAWQPVENGGEIPGVRGTEGAVVEVRLTLSTADTSETPNIDSLEVTAKEAIDSFIEYDGTAPGYPVFYIDVIDELDSLQILHVESGRFVLLEGNFQPGDAIVIDHNDQSITLNGVYRLDLLNIKSRLFRLQKGLNSFDVEPKYGATISMEWVERWK